MIFRTNVASDAKKKKNKKREERKVDSVTSNWFCDQEKRCEKKRKRKDEFSKIEVLYVPIAENLKTMAIPSLLELSMGGRKMVVVVVGGDTRSGKKYPVPGISSLAHVEKTIGGRTIGRGLGIFCAGLFGLRLGWKGGRERLSIRLNLCAFTIHSAYTMFFDEDSPCQVTPPSFPLSRSLRPLL